VKIMVMEKYEVQVLLRHYWKQNYKAMPPPPKREREREKKKKKKKKKKK
jgi:hypothetical protein